MRPGPLLPLLAALLAGAAPADVGVGRGAFDHTAWDRLLREHVSRGLVDYDSFASSQSFAGYLDDLARFDPASLPADARLAFWINAYNAYTIALVNRHGERESIRNINKTLGLLRLKGPWRERFARIGGRVLTLDEIEHDVIRREFDEPRIHFALVCAALGCPSLRSEAYVGARLEAQLQEQAEAFVLRSPTKNRVAVAARVVHLSPIFEWYADDFGGTPAAIGAWLAAIHPPGPERELLASGRFRLEYTDYDWSLNARP